MAGRLAVVVVSAQRTLECASAYRQAKGTVAIMNPLLSKSRVPKSRVPKMTPGFDKHELECPHCQKRTPLLWPGSTILFATAKCEHCSKEFVVVENKPRK